MPAARRQGVNDVFIDPRLVYAAVTNWSTEGAGFSQPRAA